MIQFLPHREHCVSIVKAGRLMRFVWEKKTAVYFWHHMKYIRKCAQYAHSLMLNVVVHAVTLKG